MIFPKFSDSSLNFSQAVELLKNGNIICYPTETFWGIGGNALDPYAVEQVYRAKKRPSGMPLPVIIGDVSQLDTVAKYSSALVDELAVKFWPGSLSILVTAKDVVPTVLTGESGRIAVRVSPHPVARELCLAMEAPLISSSANISGRPAVRFAEELDSELVEAVSGVLHLPPVPAGGKPSTLIEIAGANTVRIIRPGAISSGQLADAGIEVAL